MTDFYGMPRFFFDSSLGHRDLCDEQGIDYADLPAATDDGRKALAELVHEAISKNLLYCQVTIRDAAGAVKTRISAEIRETAGSPELPDSIEPRWSAPMRNPLNHEGGTIPPL